MLTVPEFYVSGYLNRLGLDPEPPSLAALQSLQAAHVERVPYELLDFQLGRPPSLDPSISIARIVRGRGGGCYHLNGAFSTLLRELGYQVTRHLGGVQHKGDDLPRISRNHLALTVTGLPENPAATWLVDVGLGDGFHAPLQLREGLCTQGPYTYRIRPSEIAPRGWRFDHDPAGAFLGYDIAPGVAIMNDFAEKYVWLSTAPESGFVKLTILMRRDATGVDTLKAATLNCHGAVEELESPEAWWTAAGDVFGLSRQLFTDAERQRLWALVVAQHENNTGQDVINA
ncbi:arylamine N-acetyltransferase family protein [Streptomyces chartreusis]|uniref:arylamine N-acetyltransferase family protein n=1 Tax=Streptomyces chartreusis TaxID=1969 RepID=UPI00369CBE7B